MKRKDVLVLLNAPSSVNLISDLLAPAKRLGWRLTIEERFAPPSGWRGDGAIVSTYDAPPISRFIGSLLRRGVPMVDLTISRCTQHSHRCVFDLAAVSRMVASHFRGLGFTRAVFFAMEPIPTRRMEAAAFAKAWGMDFERWIWRGGWGKTRGASVSEWLRERLVAVQKPVAVVTPNSYNAVKVLDECETAGLQVPEEVSVVSEWYEQAFCESQHVAVSGVVCDTARRMREAVRLLKRLMDGDRSAPKEVLVPPDRLVVNESSDAYAVGSPNLRHALAIIRNNLSRPLGAKQIAAEMGVSHATLDRLFASELGRSAGSEILRRRLMKAKRLMSSTNMKLSAVAAECGFCHASHLVKTFSEAEGTTPGAWRQRQ